MTARRESLRTPFARILLVGFMGSGKTQVGRLLARGLGWSFRDFDGEICAQVGLSIPEIFRQHGEGFFRDREEKIGNELLKERRVVLATGGGWPTVMGRMERLGQDTFSVWLKVTAEEALRRVRMEGPTRPLLAVADPLERARVLLREREPYYAKAHVAVDSTGAEPEELAHMIEDLMNEKGRDLTRPLPPYK